MGIASAAIIVFNVAFNLNRNLKSLHFLSVRLSTLRAAHVVAAVGRLAWRELVMRLAHVAKSRPGLKLKSFKQIP